jgi:hypothetical protein
MENVEMERSLNPAQIAWRQIPVMTKMACGAREASYSEGGMKLTFKVGRAMRWIEVSYVEGMDLYRIEFIRMARPYKRIVMESREGVYAEDMSEIIYRMVNK